MNGDSDPEGVDVSRRALLAATAGVVGLAGCSGGGDGSNAGPTGTTTDGLGGGPTDPPRTTTQAGNGSVGGSTTPTEEDGATTSSGGSIESCPMLPGSFTGYDPGAKPLPLTFEHPSAMAGSLRYVADGNWEDGNSVVGTIYRGDDREGDGDISLTVGVDYFARYEGGKENWYEQRSKLETFATTSFGDESVTFLTGETGGPYGGQYNGHTTVGLIPFDLSEPDKRGYFRAVLGIEALLYRADVDDVTEQCGENQKATLKQVVNSLSLNGATTFEQYVDP
jgi:hypothetical protein